MSEHLRDSFPKTVSFEVAVSIPQDIDVDIVHPKTVFDAFMYAESLKFISRLVVL